MKAFSYRRSLMAIAVAACGTAAHAQTPCDQQVRQIEQELQQRTIDPQRQSELRDLLQAARERPADCSIYITRAEELMSRGGQSGEQWPGEPAPTTPQPSQPAREEAPTIGQADAQTGPDEEAMAQRQEQAMAQQREQQGGQQQAGDSPQPQQQADRTLDVQVDQAPAQVDVETRSPQIEVQQQPAQVTVEQKPPQVEITQPEPQVSVEQPEPQVTVNKAEPEVQVTQSEPEVQVERSEAEVQVVQPQAQSAQTAQSQPDSGEQQSQVNLEDVQGRPALSSAGEEIGEVEDFVRSRADGSAHAVVAVGGLLGIGERNIAVPLDRASLGEDGNLRIPLSQEQVEQQEDYDPAQYEAIQQSEFAALEAELQATEPAQQ